MIVQIYEINSPELAKEVSEIGVDHIGVLVGSGKYPREIPIEEAKEIFSAVSGNSRGVALTLSDNLEEIFKIVDELNPDILHVGADEEALPLSKVGLIREGYPALKIMRAVAVSGKESIAIAKSYEKIADYLLLDTYKSQLGATGQVHDWNISKDIVEAVKIPVILAGGLGPDNVAEAIQKVNPAGVDSKTKTDKAGSDEKDIGKIKEFVAIAKSS
ncbi:MAG TPA: phosphoribosylanthranilate isomerase [Candidatus Colwellbacteria bacterium]|mgnify:CR=1 FL=1|nr:phosphoribosylanthranilate isomerase [Candidatus Colwellbacteria bacterium]